MSCDIAEVDLCLLKGIRKVFKFRYEDGDGLPIDLTNHSFEMIGDNEYLAKVATISDVTTGEFYFTFEAEDTQGIGVHNFIEDGYAVLRNLDNQGTPTETDVMFKGVMRLETL
jgi:hypothetical protein